MRGVRNDPRPGWIEQPGLMAMSLPRKSSFHSFYHSQLRKENAQHIWDFMDCKNVRDEDNLNLRTHRAAAAARPPPGFWVLQ